MDLAGGEAQAATHGPLDVGNFMLSPDGRHLVVSMNVFPDCDDLDCTRHRFEERAAHHEQSRLYDRLFIRHFDSWADGTRWQLFAYALDEQGVTSGRAGVVDARHGRRHAVPALWRRQRMVFHRRQSRVHLRGPHCRQQRVVEHELRSVPDRNRRGHAAAQSHRRQSGLGHRAGGVSRWPDPGVSRDEAARAAESDRFGIMLKDLAERRYARTVAELGPLGAGAALVRRRPVPVYDCRRRRPATSVRGRARHGVACCH